MVLKWRGVWRSASTRPAGEQLLAISLAVGILRPAAKVISNQAHLAVHKGLISWVGPQQPHQPALCPPPATHPVDQSQRPPSSYPLADPQHIYNDQAPTPSTHQLGPYSHHFIGLRLARKHKRAVQQLGVQHPQHAVPECERGGGADRGGAARRPRLDDARGVCAAQVGRQLQLQDPVASRKSGGGVVARLIGWMDADQQHLPPADEC